MVSKSTVLGAAGEHYAMCQLLRRGYIAALAPAGVPNTDIVVTDDIGERLCAIQVKSRLAKGADGGWHMKAKHEKLSSPTLFYCFVDFGKENVVGPPRAWVIPSAVVADVLTRAHVVYLATPGKKGQQRADGAMRRMLPDYDRMKQPIGCGPGWMDPYLEAWHLIESPASS